jgi:hypothetical protein
MGMQYGIKTSPTNFYRNGILKCGMLRFGCSTQFSHCFGWPNQISQTATKDVFVRNTELVRNVLAGIEDTQRARMSREHYAKSLYTSWCPQPGVAMVYTRN